MIKAEKTVNGTVTKLTLVGSIEENVNFDEVLGAPQPEMEINCRGIARINSIGVKAWIKYFQTCQKSGSKLKYTECSAAIVEQINLISNFTCGGLVETILVPFSCEGCKSELAGLYRVEDLKKLGLNIPPIKCPKCSGQAKFDDIPEEYFGFISR